MNESEFIEGTHDPDFDRGPLPTHSTDQASPYLSSAEDFLNSNLFNHDTNPAFFVQPPTRNNTVLSLPRNDTLEASRTQFQKGVSPQSSIDEYPSGEPSDYPLHRSRTHSRAPESSVGASTLLDAVPELSSLINDLDNLQIGEPGSNARLPYAKPTSPPALTIPGDTQTDGFDPNASLFPPLSPSQFIPPPSLGLIPATPISPGNHPKLGFQEILRQQVAQRRAQSPSLSGSQPSDNAPDTQQSTWSTTRSRSDSDPPRSVWGATLPPVIRPSPIHGQGPQLNPTDINGNRLPDLNVGVGGSLWDNAIDPSIHVTTPTTREASSNRRTAQANFKCPVPGCGHMESHNKERPFKCKWPGCDKGFAWQHDLKRHEALHLNIRPYICAGCQKTFARADALNRHLRSEGGAECQRVQSEITEQDMPDAFHDSVPPPRFTQPPTIIRDDRLPSHQDDVSNASRHRYETGELVSEPLLTHCNVSLEEILAEVGSVSGGGNLAESLRLVFHAIERSRVNKDQWKLLRGRCVMVTRIVIAQIIGSGQHQDLGFERVMSLLRDTFNTITAQSQRYSQLEQATEFFQFETISGEIKRLFGTLDSCLITLFLYEEGVARSQWINEFRLVQERELASLNLIRQAFLDRNEGLKRSTAGQAQSTKRKAENLRSKGMSAQEMFECLVRHGCHDMTKKVDMASVSDYAVATGAYGDIWKGKLNDSTDVAIKVWSFRQVDQAPQKCLKGAMRELYNWSKADHKNIQKLLGVVMFKDRLGMVSKWMGNGNLQDYCIEAAKAVQHLHREEMVHGDLKACNFLVSSDGVVKLTDFDHSIISCHSLIFSQTTTMGGGTMRWMAPELVMDEGEVELRSTQADIYALGMTILEIITGAPPYSECHSDAQVFYKLSDKVLPERTEQFQSAQGELLWELLVRCWDHNPTMRPSADHVADQLQLIHTTSPSGGRA